VPLKKNALKAISLFTGAGGLDLGLDAAGFRPSVCVEVDSLCRETLSANHPNWPQADPSDIHKISTDDLFSQAGLKSVGSLDLLSGGPPCQPFSKSGYWVNGDTKRLSDPRAQTLKAYLNIINHSLPKVFLLENVKGMAYKGKDEGLQLFYRSLKRINKQHSVEYKVAHVQVNCANYGVPQLRERVFIVGTRIGKAFELPDATHRTYEEISSYSRAQEFLTAWDAIGDLDIDCWGEELSVTGKWAGLLPTIPEGHNYLWHTSKGGGASLFGNRTRFWSFLLKLAKEKPSWTIQAGPGPATGPFHWRSRKLSIRELARLQTFPDEYTFKGGYRDAHRQIGNAVPPAIGYLLGIQIRKQMFSENARYVQRFIPRKRKDCPPPERKKRLPKKYWDLRGSHSDHPGEGLGPGVVERKNISGNAA